MDQIAQKIALCVERGKVNRQTPYPPDMKDQDGVAELVTVALKEGIEPSVILDGCIQGMEQVGEKFSRNEVHIPELLIASKAMNVAMGHLKMYFLSGDIQHKGTFVIGTVSGDLHDIGKNLVSMIIEGNGWEVVDLGADVSAQKFLDAIDEHPNCSVGLSALLTTTMINMEGIVKVIKQRHPDTWVLIGGAPVNQAFCEKIGANHYSPDPQGAVAYLNSIVS